MVRNVPSRRGPPLPLDNSSWPSFCTRCSVVRSRRSGSASQRCARHWLF